MRKLMWFTIGFALAVAFGVYGLGAEAYWLGAVAAAVLLTASLLCVKRFTKIRLGVWIGIGLLLGFSWQLAFHSFYLSVPEAAHGISGEFTVYATDDAEQTQYGKSLEGLMFLNGKPYSVIAYLPTDCDVEAGDRVSGWFTLSNTMLSDSDFLNSKGIFLTAKSAGVVTVEQPDSIPWFSWPASARNYITGMIDVVFPADVTAFARALLLGDADAMDYETDTAFKLSGIRHIIAVSGFHVSVLFSLIFLMTGRRNWLATVIGIPVMFFFAAVAGFAPSIMRACIMHSLMALGLLLRKEYDPPTALSFAVLLMLLGNPRSISHIGFQLSVGCVTGILLCSEGISAWILHEKRLGKAKGIWKRASNFLATTISVSVSATLITTPLSALYFGTVSLVSVLTNLLTLWVVTFCFYGIVLTCLLGAFSAAAASVLAWVTAWPLRYVLLTANMLGSLPISAVYTQSVYIVIWLILTYVLIVLYAALKHKKPLIPACCSCIFLCLALFASWIEPLTDECRVTVLDVGQGQCILLQSEGKNYLVDCGGDNETKAADKAASLLLSQGVSRLDGLILTHYDADHAAGAQYLLSRIPADRLFLPTSLDDAGFSRELAKYSGGSVQWVSDDLIIRYGNSQITLVPSQFGASDNESGLCVLFQTENCDILITGDRGLNGEMELMNHMALPELEVLIVGHHGSKYSTSESLLAATTPEYAIISVSEDNVYGHPAQEVLDRLAWAGCIVYRTDRDGTVTYRR